MTIASDRLEHHLAGGAAAARPCPPVYAATESAVDGLRRSPSALAEHRESSTVRGCMETPMTERLDRPLAAPTSRNHAELHAEARTIPLGRRAGPVEVLEAARRLAGPAARYVTGCLELD